MAEPTYRTTGAWGAGKGSNLEAAEVDGNFYALAQRLLALETNPPSPNEISNIQVVGSQVKFFLEDGTTYGPYTLPTAVFNWQGEWSPDTDYHSLDIVTVPDVGVYLVLVDTHSGSEFDSAEENSDDDAVYMLMFGQGDYEIGFSLMGIIGDDSEIDSPIHSFIAARPFYFDDRYLEKQVAKLLTAPSDSEGLILTVQRTTNGTDFFDVFTITFAPGAHNGVFAWADSDEFAQVNKGDALVTKITQGDPDAAGLGVTILAAKGIA